MVDYLTYNNIISFIQIFLDICVISIVVYYALRIIKNNSRTIQIFKGIVLIFVVFAIAKLIGLKTVEWLTTQFFNWGFLAIIIIFQPEIRSILEKIGKTTNLNVLSSLSLTQKEKLVNELVKTSVELSKTRTGAIMSLEQGQSLGDFISTGTKMNSEVTCELLCSIFVPGTPLHDGAVIIQGDKIACASAYFPPTTKEFPSIYGARHRAAVGISEISDCITIVVSEETGRISIAREGTLNTYTPDELRDYLLDNIVNISDVEDSDNTDLVATPNPRRIKQRSRFRQNDEYALIEAKEIVYRKSKPSNKGGDTHGEK